VQSDDKCNALTYFHTLIIIINNNNNNINNKNNLEASYSDYANLSQLQQWSQILIFMNINMYDHGCWSYIWIFMIVCHYKKRYCSTESAPQLLQSSATIKVHCKTAVGQVDTGTRNLARTGLQGAATWYAYSVL